MQRNYTRPQKQSKQTNLAPFYLISFVIFLLILLYGSYKVLGELRSISDGQQILILKLTESETTKKLRKSKLLGSEEYEAGETVSKIEFIKHRNETRKALRDINHQIRLIQSKLKMKKMPLSRN